MLIFKKEREARDLVLEHLKQVHHCLTESRNLLEEYVSANNEAIPQMADRVDEFESEADRLKRQAREVLLGGAFLPHIRVDIYRLVEAVDSIAGMAQEISQFLIGQSPQIPDEYHAELLEIYQQSLNCFNELRKALKAYLKPKGMFDDLMEHFAQVCEFESAVDVLESALTQRVFDSSMHLSEKMHLQQLIKRIGNIADLSEDAADELEFAAMKSVV